MWYSLSGFRDKTAYDLREAGKGQGQADILLPPYTRGSVSLSLMLEREFAYGPGKREAAQRRSDSRRERHESTAIASGSTGAGPECRAGESDEDANARMAWEAVDALGPPPPPPTPPRGLYLWGGVGVGQGLTPVPVSAQRNLLIP
jgi:hypothetical protein